MVDSVQLVLLVVIIILTILLIVLGIQVFFILRDLRQTITKANKVLEDAGSITESVQGPLSTISSLAFGLKASSLLGVAKIVRSLLSRDDDRDEKRHKKE